LNGSCAHCLQPNACTPVEAQVHFIVLCRWPEGSIPWDANPIKLYIVLLHYVHRNGRRKRDGQSRSTIFCLEGKQCRH
jgi:hypothetical protein